MTGNDVIGQETQDNKDQRSSEARIMKCIAIFRLMLHVFWCTIAAFLLSLLFKEQTCLVMWGLIAPFMVHPKGSQGYEHQMKEFPAKVRPRFEASLGDLYDSYDFNALLHPRLYYGAE